MSRSKATTLQPYTIVSRERECDLDLGFTLSVSHLTVVVNAPHGRVPTDVVIV